MSKNRIAPNKKMLLLAFLLLIAVSSVLGCLLWSKIDHMGSNGSEIALLNVLVFTVFFTSSIAAAVSGLSLLWAILVDRPWLGSFRLIFWPFEDTWVIFYVGLWLSMVGIGFQFFPIMEVEELTGEGKAVLLSFTAVVALVLTTLITNILRLMQYFSRRIGKLDGPQGLDAKAQPLEVRLGRKIQDLEVLIARDMQSQRELSWTMEYQKFIDAPRLSKPCDILSLDSQISVRAIYPAAMLLWSEQARLRLSQAEVDWVSEDAKVQEIGATWRGSLTAFLTRKIGDCHRNFKDVCQLLSSGAPRQNQQDIDFKARPLSARILIYDYALLKNDVVKAVIHFHEVIGVPLFFVPTEILHRLDPDVYATRKNEWDKIRGIAESYLEFQQRMHDVDGGRWGNSSVPGKPADLGFLWRGSGDDFIIVDDAAWVGYPSEQDGDQLANLANLQQDPLLFHLRFYLLLGVPGMLLAKDAMVLAQRPQGLGTLAEWHREILE